MSKVQEVLAKYVGKTKKTTKSHVNINRHSVNLKREDLSIARHFSVFGHTWKNTSVLAIDHKSAWNQKSMLIKKGFR